MFDLVILDCDGVLVDSERLTTVIIAQLATEVGVPTAAEDAIARFKGRELAEIRREIEAVLGTPVRDDFEAEYRRRMRSVFDERGVPAIAGAAALLDGLDAASIPHVIASNGPQSKMELTLGRLGPPPGGWYERFAGRCFSAYDVGSWKPEPGLFLHAAEAMGVEAARCVVIEDSVSGIRAAVAAGMHACGFTDLTPGDELRRAGADAVCASHEEVARHLGVRMTLSG